MKLAAALLLGAVSLLLASCFYMPGVAGGKARAGLVLPKFIAADTTSLALIVGGPGMDPLFATYPVGTTSVTLSVPSGTARTFTLLANTPSVTLKGETTVDLQPGETKDIVLTPAADSSQIIVPDNATGRLVQVADLSGAGWTTSTPVTSPYDVDFDDQGRIYIASNSYSGPGIVRINDINDTSPFTLTGVTGTNIRSIAMDRTRGLLYYTDGFSLWRIQVTPTLGTQELVDLSSQSISVSTVKGIAVDSDGFVYIGSNPFLATEVLKINPNPAASPSVVASYSGALAFAYDVLVNGDFVYVSDPSMSAPKIVQLDKNLKFVNSFSGPVSDPFLGPERFVAVMNKRITVVDQPHDISSFALTTKARLVSFDMTGGLWSPYGSYGTGPGQFEFYNSFQY